MSGFSPVDFSWGGETYSVPADRQFLLIQQVEEALVGNSGRQAVEVILQAGGPPHAKLAAAYGAALRFAGADVSDGDVYLKIQRAMADQDVAVSGHINGLIMALLAVCSPPIAAKLALAKVSKGDGGKKTDTPEVS